MFIEGIGIGEYRSFGTEAQKIGPFTKVNFLVGQNNCGKSNVLRFIREHYASAIKALADSSRMSFTKLDRHVSNGQRSMRTSISLCLDLKGERFGRLLNAYPPNRNDIERIVNSDILTNGSGAAWLDLTAINENSSTDISESVVTGLLKSDVLQKHEWNHLWATFTRQSGGDLKANWIPEVLRKIFSFGLSAPEINIIQAIRRIGEPNSTPDDFSGNGIITRLAQIQNPDHDRQEIRSDFLAINEFVQKVVGNSSARIEIPYERDKINVHMDGKVLPIDHLGTGIHEVIILAAAATVIKDQVLCIEEPELHLHPMLQKKLIRYLEQKTDNQYFITTHSAHLLDTPNSSIFHIRLQEGQSTVDPVFTAVQKSLVCSDLGYRASDIVQTNCVIWVEGPSDRLYLNHWIKAVDPELIEGIHYSIMFYGGRLLSHLSADDPEITEFISLRRMNRYIAVVMDSDKSSARKQINATKKRIRMEFDEGPGFAWITKGREIENYIEPHVITTCLKDIQKDFHKLVNTNSFRKAYTGKTSTGRHISSVDKVKLAHAVTNHPANLDVLDLKTQINRLVKFIHESNDTEISFLN